MGTNTNSTLHQAMDHYSTWITSRQSADGRVSHSGLRIIKMVLALKKLLPDAKLDEIEHQGVTELFGILQYRPRSERTGRPLSTRTCREYIAVLKRIFEWIDLRDDYLWTLPSQWDRSKPNPVRLDSDSEFTNSTRYVLSVEQCCTLYQYATPIERLVILLGLNCGLNGRQIGGLKLRQLMLDNDPPRIAQRDGKHVWHHRLWSHTTRLLRWAMEQRRTELGADDFVLLKKSGLPYFRVSESGNTVGDISRLWNRLIDRIQKDIHEFPQLSFSRLRATSIVTMQKIAGQSIASAHAMHLQRQSDSPFAHYIGISEERLFEAHSQLETYFRPIFVTVADAIEGNEPVA